MFGDLDSRSSSSKASASRLANGGRATTRGGRSSGLNLLGLSVPIALASLAFAGSAAAAQSPVGLGTTGSYGVLGGQSVTNTGPSDISGDLGVSPGTAISGFPPGLVLGTMHSADAQAGQAQSDLTTAYNDAAGRSPDANLATELGGQTLTPGAYRSPTLGITGALTLDAQGDPNAVFIFQAGSTLITASNSSVNLINGAQACNVYWQVGSSATIGTGTRFVGNVLALTSIAAQTGATVQGRLMARNGSTTLDTNVITRSQCAADPGPGPGPGPGPTPGPGTGTGPSPGTPTVTATQTGSGASSDQSGPNVRILRVPRSTTRRFTAGVRVSDRSGVSSVTVYLDGRRVRRTARTRFSVRINAQRLRVGSHRITVVAIDRAGNRSVTRRRFSRRARTWSTPRFAG